VRDFSDNFSIEKIKQKMVPSNIDYATYFQDVMKLTEMKFEDVWKISLDVLKIKEEIHDKNMIKKN